MADYSIKVALIDDHHVAYTTANNRVMKGRISNGALSKALIARFNHWIADDDTRYERADFELLGRLLYETLFPDHCEAGAESIRDRFEADYSQFYNQTPASESDRFRLTLELHESATSMAAYPWEFLYIPRETAEGTRPADGGFF